MRSHATPTPLRAEALEKVSCVWSCVDLRFG